MTPKRIRNQLWCSAALTLAACGGGGGGGMSFIPLAPAPPTPTPTPTPPPPAPVPPPVPAGPIGLQSSAPFATRAVVQGPDGSASAGPDLVAFSYSAATNRYTITLPSFQTGELVTTGAGGSFNQVTNTWTHIDSTSNDVTNGRAAVQPVSVTLQWPVSSDYKYTSSGSWRSTALGATYGSFAYGIPTVSGDVPLAGGASYLGSVQGTGTNDAWVGGTVSLSFDFGAGSLSGVMKPTVAPSWDSYPLGDYTFRETSFSKGGTTFSGSFDVSGTTAPSSFQGSFNGPQAAELMANWSAPFLNPETKEWQTMSGIWIAKKP